MNIRNREDAILAQSKSVEDFLKAVYVLQQQLDASDEDSADLRVSTNALADVLNISAPSVTDMARRLAESDLVNYKRYYGVRLTERGTSSALHVLRRHRLIELYLAEELGYDLHEVHDEAEKLEHVVSERFVEAIARKLGHPTTDPHGDPIPAADGTVLQLETTPLSDLPLNVTAAVSRFKADNGDMLQHILERGFRLGINVVVRERDPFDGPLTVDIAGEKATIGHSVANCILVEVV